MSQQKQFHAWYSQQAVDSGCGTAFYRSSKNGSEVEVTAVYDAKDPYVPSKGEGSDGEYMWPDAQYRGLVTDFLRIGHRSWLDFTFAADMMPMDDIRDDHQDWNDEYPSLLDDDQ